MNRETNYFRWNPEARALFAFQLSYFAHMFLMSLWLTAAAVVVLLVHLIAMTVWSLWYLSRAGDQKRRHYEFIRVWGPPCRICGARDGERCDAGLHS